MRSPSSDFQTTIAGDQLPLAWLVEIQASTTYRYALYSTDITFNSITYSANSGTFDQVSEGLEGKAPAVRLKIQNIDRAIRDILDASDLRGTVVILRVVMTDDLADSTAVVETEFEIDSYSWDAEGAQINLQASNILRGVQVPGRVAQNYYCPFKYRGAECGYVTAGGIASCDFTYGGRNGCTKHFAKTVPKRFGGFIGSPQRGIEVF